MPNQYVADVTRLTSNDSGPRDPSRCQLAVIHTYECPRADDLESRAAYQETHDSSYTILVGTHRTLRANDDNYIPWAAMPTGNRLGLHLSFLAYAASSRQEWLDHSFQLDLAAAVVADWCTRYGIPPVKLTADEVRSGKRGICGHNEVSQAWHESDHTDPGAGFPWDEFITRVKARMNGKDTTTMPELTGVSAAALNDAKLAAQSTAKMTAVILEQQKEQTAMIREIRDQLCGINPFNGWPQGGNRTLYDLAAASAEKLGVDGAKDTRKA